MEDDEIDSQTSKQESSQSFEQDILDYNDEDEDLLIVSITADHMALSSRVTFTPVKS